jgi:hypothetical protein
MRKLTIVVTCTDRKSVSPADHLRIRSLPPGTLPERSDEWQRRLGRDNRAVPLGQLYQGGAWTEVSRLEQQAHRSGFTPRTLVASAGLGLRAVTTCAPSYAATFNTGHSDSVAASAVDAAEWWLGLGQLPGALEPEQDLRGRVLLVLGNTYARALRADLQTLAAANCDALLVGGSEELAGLPRLPSDIGLRHHFGGTATTINLRMAREWLARLTGSDLHTEPDRRAWDRWARRVRRVERYERRTVSDTQARELILQLREKQPDVSATRALQSLRASGIACEQARFRTLFAAAVAAHVS